MAKKFKDIEGMLNELIGSSAASPSIEEASAYYKRRIALLSQTIDDTLVNCDDFAVREYQIGEAYEEAELDLKENIPWYEDGAAAVAAGIILSETTKLAFGGAVTLAAVSVIAVISSAAASYVKSRLRNYTKLHPEIETIDSFESKTFSILEATAKYNIGFRMANKWNEKLDKTVNVRVWFKNNRPVMAIAYGAKGGTVKTPHVNSEFVLMDKRYSKLEDYYSAGAHASVKLGHPSIKRMVQKMREEWKDAREAMTEKTAKVVQEAYLEDNYEDMQQNVLHAFESGMITYEEADAYLSLMEECSIDTENNDLYDWA